MSLISKFSEKEREFPHCHLIQFICFISFFSVWFFDSFVIVYSVSLSFLIPLFFRFISFFIVLLISFKLLRSIDYVLLKNENKTEKKRHRHYLPDHVIDYGVMAHVRHPLYLAILLFYFAFVVLTISILSFLGWTIIFFIHDRMASFEEKQLILMFNEDYKQYKERVPKWIPNPLQFIQR